MGLDCVQSLSLFLFLMKERDGFFCNDSLVFPFQAVL